MILKLIEGKLYTLYSGKEPFEVEECFKDELIDLCYDLCIKKGMGLEDSEIFNFTLKEGIHSPELCYRIKLKYGCDDKDCDDSCGIVKAILLPEIKNYSPSCQTCYYSDNGERPCNRHLNKLKPDYLKGVECALNNYIHYRPFENPNKIQMKRFKFYKEESDRWYVDLPDWTGTKEDLELVAGADTMLEYMSEGEKEIWLVLSEEKFENGDTLEFIRLATEFENGAFYLMKNYKGIEINLELWLCDVLNFVFKKFPKVLYLQKI